MRRSGAPSQLLGNAVKKPRFVPPGGSASCPLAPKLGLGNALDKVQRSLSAAVVNKSTCSVQGQTGQTASGLSKVLARVLTATESKENDDETKYEDSTEDINVSGWRFRLDPPGGGNETTVDFLERLSRFQPVGFPRIPRSSRRRELERAGLGPSHFCIVKNSNMINPDVEDSRLRLSMLRVDI